MKKAFILWTIVMFIPSFGFSSYIIELETGSRFLTDQYWEEDGKVHCTLYGGVAAFNKQTVKVIRKSSDPCTWEENISSSDANSELNASDASTKIDPEEQADGKADVTSDAAPSITPEEKALFLAEKHELEQLYRQAGERFMEAKNNGTKKDIESVTQELLKLRHRETALVKTIKNRSNGSIPSWWTSSLEDD
ncbi:MAG: hypothetical protein R6U50_11685 [Desulfobacterales bacterium]